MAGLIIVTKKVWNLVFPCCTVANCYSLNNPGAIHKKRCWESFYIVRLRNFPGGITQYRKRNRVLVEILLNSFLAFVYIYSNNGQSFIGIFVVNFTHHGHFLTAGSAPASPEVNPDILIVFYNAR